MNVDDFHITEHYIKDLGYESGQTEVVDGQILTFTIPLGSIVNGISIEGMQMYDSRQDYLVKKDYKETYEAYLDLNPKGIVVTKDVMVHMMRYFLQNNCKDGGHYDSIQLDRDSIYCPINKIQTVAGMPNIQLTIQDNKFLNLTPDTYFLFPTIQ